jgi:hypothetical protein
VAYLLLSWRRPGAHENIRKGHASRATGGHPPVDALPLLRRTLPTEPGTQAQRRARLSIQPIFILREMLQHLRQERIVAPAYRTLQDVVGRVVTGERDRVSQLLDRELSRATRERLDSLFEAGEYLHRVSALRKEPRGFS